MLTIALHNANGIILMRTTVPNEEVAAKFCASKGWGYLPNPPDFDCYVDLQERVFFAMPPQPSPDHVFDEVTKRWTDPRTLENLKDQRWAAIKAERDKREESGFVYLGQLLQSDARSVLRINTRGLAARAAIDAGETLTTYWKATDNTLMELDAHQMAAMPSALSDYASGLHTTAGFLLAMIEAADTPEEVASVVWPV